MNTNRPARHHHHLFDAICTDRRGCNLETLEQVLTLAIELAREGREGRKIGTMFVVGDSENVLVHSRPLILDPLLGHADASKRVAEPWVRETVKELSQLDGAFVVSDEGVVISAARFIESTMQGVRVPLGLGTRHMAAASITAMTDAVAIVVSESSVVRVFDNGELISEVIPELWLLQQYGSSFLGSEAISLTDSGTTFRSRKE